MLGKIHFYLGIIIVIIFLLTGQYMHHQYDHLQDMELMKRALFRAGHLYILLFGLINVALGIGYKSYESKVYTRIQQFASIVVIGASTLVILAFFYELPAQQIERPLTRFSLYLILFGISIHGLLHLFIKKNLNQTTKF